MRAGFGGAPLGLLWCRRGRERANGGKKAGRKGRGPAEMLAIRFLTAFLLKAFCLFFLPIIFTLRIQVGFLLEKAADWGFWPLITD